MKNKEVIVAEGKLNEVIIKETIRANGTVRIQQDFSFCPTMAEQHTAHLSDLNYLVEKYKPDELAAYLTAKTQHRREILGHDFAREPSMQDAKNEIYKLRQAFENLPEDFKRNFKNHVEFLKYIDNVDNQQKLIKAKILSEKEVSKLTSDSMTTTKKEETVSESKQKPS